MSKRKIEEGDGKGEGANKKNRNDAFITLDGTIKIDFKCLTHRKDIELKVLNRIGSGHSGSVFEACVTRGDQKNCDDWVVKVIKSSPTRDIPALLEIEVGAQQAAAEIGLAPVVLDWWICDNEYRNKYKLGVILMRKVKNVVPEIDQDDDIEPIDMAAPLGYLIRGLFQLHKRGWAHWDVITNTNVLYTRDGEVWLVDFGGAEKLTWKEPRRTTAELAKEAAGRMQLYNRWQWLIDKGWLPKDHRMTDGEVCDFNGACENVWELIYKWETGRIQRKTPRPKPGWIPELRPPRTPWKPDAGGDDSKQSSSSSSMKLLTLKKQ